MLHGSIMARLASSLSAPAEQRAKKVMIASIVMIVIFNSEWVPIGKNNT